MTECEKYEGDSSGRGIMVEGGLEWEAQRIIQYYSSSSTVEHGS